MFCHSEFEVPHTFCIVHMRAAFLEAFINHGLDPSLTAINATHHVEVLKER